MDSLRLVSKRARLQCFGWFYSRGSFILESKERTMRPRSYRSNSGSPLVALSQRRNKIGAGVFGIFGGDLFCNWHVVGRIITANFFVAFRQKSPNSGLLTNDSQVIVMGMDKSGMKLKLFSLGALVLCTSAASNAATSGDVGTTTIANRFVDALQHQRYKDAAAMFASRGVGNITTTEHTLKRIDESLGGFSTIHPIAALPDGESIKLEVAAHKNTPLKIEKFVQIRYASTASDGQPVFYELNLAVDGIPPRILSFWLHFPAADAQSLKRANQLVTFINR